MVLGQSFQFGRRKKFVTVWRRVSQRFKESGSNQRRHVVFRETQECCGLLSVQPGRQPQETENCVLVHVSLFCVKILLVLWSLRDDTSALVSQCVPIRRVISFLVLS